LFVFLPRNCCDCVCGRFSGEEFGDGAVTSIPDEQTVDQSDSLLQKTKQIKIAFTF
jgi:hypothetical protein